MEHTRCIVGVSTVENAEGHPDLQGAFYVYEGGYTPLDLTFNCCPICGKSVNNSCVVPHIVMAPVRNGVCDLRAGLESLDGCFANTADEVRAQIEKECGQEPESLMVFSLDQFVTDLNDSEHDIEDHWVGHIIANKRRMHT